MTGLGALCALGAGSLLALKAGCEARLGVLIADPLRATAAGLLLAGLGLGAAAWTSGAPYSAPWAATPPWQLLGGGLLIALATAALCWLVPRWGLGRAIPLCLAGQLIASLVAAALGLFDQPSQPPSSLELLGALSVLGGVFALTAHSQETPMDFTEIVTTRYAAKRFDGTPLPAESVEQLLELIRLAPTSYNLQPWRVAVIPPGSERAALAEAAWGQAQIESCSHLLVFCANTELEVLAARLEERLLAEGAPAESVASFVRAARAWIESLGEARLAWAQRQTYLALGNGLNGARSLGFDACPMEGFRPEAFAELLGLPETLVPTALLALGHATDAPRAKLRFRRDELFLQAAAPVSA